MTDFFWEGWVKIPGQYSPHIDGPKEPIINMIIRSQITADLIKPEYMNYRNLKEVLDKLPDESLDIQVEILIDGNRYKLSDLVHEVGNDKLKAYYYCVGKPSKITDISPKAAKTVEKLLPSNFGPYKL